MSNTHALPDTLFEIEAIWGDLGPSVLISQSGLTVPASSLTLPAVAASGYVLRTGPPARLVYVSQPAISVTLTSTAGNYWLGLHADLSTAVSGWTRRAGSHLVWQLAATRPANPDSILIFCGLTVAGGVITVVTPLADITGPPMSRQDSAQVTITGGTATFSGPGLAGPTAALTAYPGWAYLHALDCGRGGFSSMTQGQLEVGGPAHYYSTLQTEGNVGIRHAIDANIPLWVDYTRASQQAILVRSVGSDTGGNAALLFLSSASTGVGSITTTATATAFNTSSDHRLKHAIQPLTGALARVLALRPVAFLWTQDDSPGVGFVAGEVAAVVDGVITGEPDAVDDEGNIVPQQIDHSKLVPYLTGAIKELLAQVEVLTAKVQMLEDLVVG